MGSILTLASVAIVLKAYMSVLSSPPSQLRAGKGEVLHTVYMPFSHTEPTSAAMSVQAKLRRTSLGLLDRLWKTVHIMHPNCSEWLLTFPVFAYPNATDIHTQCCGVDHRPALAKISIAISRRIVQVKTVYRVTAIFWLRAITSIAHNILSYTDRHH